MGSKRKVEPSVSMDEVVGKPIRFQDVSRLYMAERSKGRALTTGIHYPGRLTVTVGTFVALFPSNERREWYLYVTGVSNTAGSEVVGYFAYTDYTIRQKTGCKEFRSDCLVLTHDKFTTCLSTVKRTVPVLPGCFAGNAFPEGTLYYDAFWDTGASQIRKINFQLKHPQHLFEFLSSNAVVGSGGGEISLFYFKRSFRSGLEKWCERWRNVSISPKRGVFVSMSVVLEELMCLPFTLVQCATVDTEKESITIPLTSEDDLKHVLGHGWTIIKQKARQVRDGELIKFEFHLPAKLVHCWRSGLTITNFHGATCCNGAGVQQWCTLGERGG